MLQDIWDSFYDAFNLGGLFDIIKTIFYAVLIIIAIAIVVFIVLFVITCIAEVKEEEKKEKEEEKEKAEQKRKDAESKKYYLEGLPAIYDKWSTEDLKVIHGYLETIDHCQKVHDYYCRKYGCDFDIDIREMLDKKLAIEMATEKKLLAHLGYPKWKWLYNTGRGFLDRPGFITEDINYVYSLIQSRK